MDHKVDGTAHLPRGRDGLVPGYKWVEVRDSIGVLRRFQAPLDWPRKATKATPRKATTAARTAIAGPIELLRRGQERYALVDLRLVDSDTRRAAEKMAKLCARELGLKYPPSVVWIAVKGDPAWRLDADGVAGPLDRLGFFLPNQPGMVYVRAGLSPEDAAAVVAHESRHFWQHKQAGLALEVGYHDDPDMYERDAHDFMYRMLARYGGELQ